MINGARLTMQIGTRSAATYPALRMKLGWMAMGPIGLNSSVSPSGLARTTCAAAMVPAAPVMLFTTTGWPSEAGNSIAISRATISAAEPAPKAVKILGTSLTKRSVVCAET